MSSERNTVDISPLLDGGQWGGYQRFVVALAAMALIFDGADIQVLGVAVPTLMKEWSMPRSAFVPVIAIGLVGMALGSVFIGIIGDRWGRRRALIGSITVLGIFTAVASQAHDVRTLEVLRLLAGFGLGGALPNASALAAEYVPLRHRPFAVTLTIVCIPLGSSLAGLVAAHVLPVHGWRVLFMAGGAAAVGVALVLSWLLPESPRFMVRNTTRWPELSSILARIGRPVGSAAQFVDSRERTVTPASVRALVTREYARDTLLLWCAFFSCLLAIYMGFNLLPSMLTNAGLNISIASNGIAAFNLGGVAGAIGAALLIYRFGSRSTMVVIAIVGIAGALVLRSMHLDAVSVASVIGMLALTGGAINAVQTTMYALAAHMYPTAVRATGVGAASTAGRCGAIASAYVGNAAIEWGGSASFFLVMAMTVTVTTVALLLVRRHIAAGERV
jgi:AAHS family 4-hydroxybenzoate transporter-like MFS transporter